MLYYAERRWWIGDKLGELAGFFHSGDCDITEPTECPRGQWSVATHVGLQPAPEVECISESAHAAAMHSRLAKAKASRVVYLTGVTPNGEATSMLGAYHRRCMGNEKAHVNA